MNDRDRFFSYVEKTDTCWLWTGKNRARGYGRIRIGEKHLLAHRYSWELVNGPIPTGLHALHNCDNPPCVNPAHLYLGTPLENMRDREVRHRAEARRRGSNHPRATLTDAQVLEIFRSTEGGSAIARRLGTNKFIVSEIRCGKAWNHLTGLPRRNRKYLGRDGNVAP